MAATTTPAPGSPFLLGGPQNQYDPAYGGIPLVPSPGASAGGAIGSNVGNLASIYGLATGAGGAGGAGVLAGLGKEIPGVTNLIGKGGGNIGQMLAGKVPQDVLAQLKQQSAEIGAGRGLGPMSPSSNAEYLKSLGLTSLGMEKEGLADLESLISSVPKAPAFDPSSMFVAPHDQQQWNYLASTLRNAPVPKDAADANLKALMAGTGAGQPSRGVSFAGPAIGFHNPNTDALGFPTTDMGASGYGPNLGPVGGINLQAPPSAASNWSNLASTWAASRPTGAGQTMMGQPTAAEQQYYEQTGMWPGSDPNLSGESWQTAQDNPENYYQGSDIEDYE